MRGKRFENHHVAVTGGGRGIGRATAIAFAREGARVSIFSRGAENAAEAVRRARSEKLHVEAFACDVGDPDQVERMIAEAVRAFGPVDALVNNAGIFVRKPFLELSPAEWSRVLATNLTGAYNFCRAVLPSMVEKRRGRIVNVASIHGLHGDALLAAHCAAKFGLIGMTQSLAREFRDRNVTVNAVCPGTTENLAPEHEVSPRAAPLSEKLRPQDVASTILWLCSEEASGITGAAIEIYGGTQMRIEP